MKYLWIVRSLFLLVSLLSLHAEQSMPVQEMNCKNLSINNANFVKEKAVSTLVESDIFKEFSKKYPKNTKFAFPLEVAKIQDNQKCVVEVSVYIDENDHYSLIASFLVKNKGSIVLQNQ
jgi:hypothetical protein